eukprot:TRINITY_DN274_c1_g2_i1.p1 TRINITY_DN274_c1_g2~~TRINITY_DN274_c1_g2_i1.p1  ORF type:complete len:196 (+),score=2.83 TRINITY_DN274_c1_g2_i1:169-756(+)
MPIRNYNQVKQQNKIRQIQQSELFYKQLQNMSHKVQPFLALTVLNGSRKGAVIPVLSNSITVGRSVSEDSNCVDVTFEDESISQMHAEFKFIKTRGYWGVKDRKSSNGTVCNCVAVTSQKFHELRSGDIITLGDVDILILILSEFSLKMSVSSLYDFMKDGLKKYVRKTFESQREILRANIEELAKNVGAELEKY